MSYLQFAVAIVFPGAGVPDIVEAAAKNHVHIIDKEDYDAQKDYEAFSKSYEPYINGSRILLLFIFPEGRSILASDPTRLSAAIEEIKGFNN
jgi:hypothetical protein